MVVDDPLALIFSNIFLRLGSVLCGTDVVLKLEGFSITGSIKIKSALFMIQELSGGGLPIPGRRRSWSRRPAIWALPSA